jgi:hypothetical protein
MKKKKTFSPFVRLLWFRLCEIDETDDAAPNLWQIFLFNQIREHKRVGRGNA